MQKKYSTKSDNTGLAIIPKQKNKKLLKDILEESNVSRGFNLW